MEYFVYFEGGKGTAGTEEPLKAGKNFWNVRHSKEG